MKTKLARSGRTASGMDLCRHKKKRSTAPSVHPAKAKNKAAWNPHPYLVAAARRVWRWAPERKALVNACAVGPTKRRCIKCTEVKARKEVQIDHIEPVGKQPRSWADYPGFYERLFCPVSNLQPLCKDCHTAKSNAENKARKEA